MELKNIIEVNDTQTKITDELLNGLSSECREELLTSINSIQFIKNIISPTRKRAKDLPRDEDGKIIVDLCNPHILEDMDYFRPSAIHFEKYGSYGPFNMGNVKPNANTNSEYYKWLKEEQRRCWDGYIRPSDGEWVTGYLYWFLNYSPIMIVKKGKKKGTGDRVFGFPKIWDGIYWRFHYIDQARNGGKYNDFKGGLHCAELASRGRGKSFSMGSILSHNFIMGRDKNTCTRTMSMVAADTKEYLLGDGSLNKFIAMIDFDAKNTQFPKQRLKNSQNEMQWKIGTRNLNTNAEEGWLNEVLGIAINSDSDKLRGKRAIHIIFEEFGSFAELINTYKVARPSVEQDDISFGQMILVGTANTSSKDFMGAQEIVYNPKGYGIYALPNVWDKAEQGKPFFTFFFPAYINYGECMDNNGNSDVVAALIKIINNRLQVKYSTSDPNTILGSIAEKPITPSEAILQVNSNIFPVMDINNRILQLQNNLELNDSYIGELVLEKGNIVFQPTEDQPIRKFPHESNKIKGAIEIFTMPEKDDKNNIIYGRYILGVDPYDNDTADSSSLGSVFVLDLFTDKIVAEYTGRPMYADDFYEIVRKLCIFYNGCCLYENNKKGLFAYFQKMNSTHYLADTPEYLRDKQLIKNNNFGNNSKGVTANKALNSYARSLLRDWLLKPIHFITNDEEEEKEGDTYNLYYIRSISLLLELSMWNEIGNFDRVSAMGMLMLIREEKMIYFQGNPNSNTNDSNYLGNDPFFTNNFNSYKGYDFINHKYN